jgi:3-hydroxyisobutyrate dehydrogenase-like beta-hydroxyacid dehydrogenase
MTRVGFVGLGAMGLPMAQNLLKAGFEVAGFDLRARLSMPFLKPADGGRRAPPTQPGAPTH